MLSFLFVVLNVLDIVQHSAYILEREIRALHLPQNKICSLPKECIWPTCIKAQKADFCGDDEWNLTVFLIVSFIVKNKKSCGFLMSVHDVQSVIMACFYSPCRLEMDQNGRGCDFKWKLKIDEQLGREIYTACFPLGHTPGLSAPLCVAKHAVRGACKGLGEDSTLLCCYWITSAFVHVVSQSKFCCKKEKKTCMKMCFWQ